MNNRELLARFIREVINENDGIYSWSCFPIWDDNEREMIIEKNPELWREKILINDWMINSPGWFVFEVGMLLVNGYGEVISHEDRKFLVERTITLEEFDRKCREKLGSPIYIEWIHVHGKDGGYYENIELPSEPFKSIIPEDERIFSDSEIKNLKKFDQSLKYTKIL